MAKIKKIQKSGETIYPATIFQAVKNPENGQTIGEEIGELRQETDNFKQEVADTYAAKTGDYPQMVVGNNPPLSQLIGRGVNYFTGFYLGGSIWLEGNNEYILIPVRGGDNIHISCSNAIIQYALLQDVGVVEHLKSPVFCSGYTGRLTASSPLDLVCPSDCKFVYVLRSYEGTLRDLDITINGIQNILDSIGDIREQIAQQENVFPTIMAEKTSDKLLMYKRMQSNRYICYPLNYRKKDYVADSYPSFYDNWGIAQPYIAEFTGAAMIQKEFVFASAEAELAISVPNGSGTNEYVGGMAHGFENINTLDGERTVAFMVNNIKIGETATLPLQKVDEVVVIQQSSLYQSRTNTDAWATAIKEWYFNTEGLKIKTSVEIVRSLTIAVAQFGMFGVYRHWLGNASNPYLADKAVKSNHPFRVYSIDDGGIPVDLQIPDANCHQISVYGEKQMGFALKIEDAVTKDGGGMLIATNNSIYNKIYYTLGKQFSPAVGDVLTATQVWSIYENEA